MNLNNIIDVFLYFLFALRSFNQSNSYQPRSNGYSNSYGDNQRNGGGFKSNSGMSNGGFRNDSYGFQNRNGGSGGGGGGGFRNGGDKFGGGNRGGGYDNQSFGGKGLKSVEWGVKTLRPVNKPAYVPHSAIVNRSSFEVGVTYYW